jgi:phage recombination protein Bet
MTTQAIQSPAPTEVKPAVVAGTSLISYMAARHNLEPTKFLSTLIKTVFPSDKQNPSNEQVAAFLAVAKQYDLNPFIKEIYAFPARGGGIVPIVSVDGWCTLINRQPALDGIDFEFHFDDQERIQAVTTTIHRKDRSHPTRITEYMSECGRNTDPWKSHPVRMLRHKSLIQCARLAFGLAGIYDEDEAERIAEAEPVSFHAPNGSQPSKAERIAAQLQDHPAVVEAEVVESQDSEASPNETKNAEPLIDEKTEKKKLRKSIKEMFPEEQIEKHTGGRDINALSLDELVQLKDGLMEYKD